MVVETYISVQLKSRPSYTIILNIIGQHWPILENTEQYIGQFLDILDI